MFELINQVFIVLLSFSRTLATKWSLNNETCMTRATLIDLNPVELNYYSFMISLTNCNGRFNVVDDLTTKACVPGKAKGISVKVFDTTTGLYDAKKMG